MTARKTFLVFVVFFAVGIGAHVFAPTLNGLKALGLPAGYGLAAQGGPILLAALFVLLRRDTSA